MGARRAGREQVRDRLRLGWQRRGNQAAVRRERFGRRAHAAAEADRLLLPPQLGRRQRRRSGSRRHVAGAAGRRPDRAGRQARDRFPAQCVAPGWHRRPAREGAGLRGLRRRGSQRDDGIRAVHWQWPDSGAHDADDHQGPLARSARRIRLAGGRRRRGLGCRLELWHSLSACPPDRKGPAPDQARPAAALCLSEPRRAGWSWWEP